MQSKPNNLVGNLISGTTISLLVVSYKEYSTLAHCFDNIENIYIQT